MHIALCKAKQDIGKENQMFAEPMLWLMYFKISDFQWYLEIIDSVLDSSSWRCRDRMHTDVIGRNKNLKQRDSIKKDSEAKWECDCEHKLLLSQKPFFKSSLEGCLHSPELCTLRTVSMATGAQAPGQGARLRS